MPFTATLTSLHLRLLVSAAAVENCETGPLHDPGTYEKRRVMADLDAPVSGILAPMAPLVESSHRGAREFLQAWAKVLLLGGCPRPLLLGARA